MKVNDYLMSNSSWKYLGWAGAFLVLVGYYLNANKMAECWATWIIGNLCMGLYCANKKAYPAAAMSFVIVAMNVYGYFSWRHGL